MRALVTGIAGFIGSNLASRLLESGHQVIGVDSLSNGFIENVPQDAEFIEADLAEPGTLGMLPKSIDVIYHLAGQASGENSFYQPLRDLNENTASTINIIRYGISGGAERLIFSSSTSVYGHVSGETVREDMPCRPISGYGISKYAAEQYINLYQHELPATIFRLSNTYGAGQNLVNMMQGMVSIYLAQALKTGRIQVKGSLDRFRDFIEISDVVRALMLAGDTGRADGETINLATGVKTRVADVLVTLKESLRDIDWYVEGSTPGDHPGYYADTAKLESVLGFRAEVPFRDGCTNFVRWAQQFRSHRGP